MSQYQSHVHHHVRMYVRTYVCMLSAMHMDISMHTHTHSKAKKNKKPTTQPGRASFCWEGAQVVQVFGAVLI